MHLSETTKDARQVRTDGQTYPACNKAPCHEAVSIPKTYREIWVDVSSQ